VQLNDADTKTVKLALQDILDSPGFANSSQLQNFLTFIVNKTLEGKTEDIKGYTIGVDALGRPDDFDPQTDPSVRVMAGRLRQALDNYNRDGGFTRDGKNLNIELVKGSYVPRFEFSNVANTETGKKDGLAVLEDTDILINFDIEPEKQAPPTAHKANSGRPVLRNTLFGILAAGVIGLGAITYDYFINHSHVEPMQLPEKQVISIEESMLPSITLYIDTDDSDLPKWISGEKLASSAVLVFSRFNEYRLLDLHGKEELIFDDQMISDYYLSVLYSRLDATENIEAFLTLTRPPESEVIWSEKIVLEPTNDIQNNGRTKNTSKVSEVVSSIMSPYGIIHGDIANSSNPPARLDCIRAIYSYFYSEDMQAYANGLDCARRATTRPNASSSMFAIRAFLYVEAHRKLIAGVSESPLDEAEALANQAILLDPRNARAYQAILAVEKSRGRHEKAMAAGRKAIELNPFDRDILGDFASYLIAVNRQEEAKPYLQQALRLTPALPAWLAFYSFLHADATGDTARADRLANTFSADHSSLLATAIILSAHRQKDETRLQAAITALEKLEPGFVQNPTQALLRRGFDEEFAQQISSRLEDAGLGWGSQTFLNNFLQ